MSDIITCTPKSLDRTLWHRAASRAIDINPSNHAPVERLARIMTGFVPTADHLAVLVDRRWPASGVILTVGFLDNPPRELKDRILSHMNAWNKTANVRFVESSIEPKVRITRTPRGGHWSFLGTDIEQIPGDQATMNLDGFTMQTRESEFHRVVRHETGHTLGFPHEHLRRELVELIDATKAIKYFGDTQGWSPEMVRQQVLTPIDEASLLGTDHADPDSIMCYQIPGEITKHGKPIAGGPDIDQSDYEFAAKVYPKVPSTESGAMTPPVIRDLLTVGRDRTGELVMTLRLQG